MTDWRRYLVVGIGGFVGANARYIANDWISRRFGTSLPYGTFLINMSGSFILGLSGTLAVRLGWNPRWRLLIAVGFVGAYTTFSTFEYETVELILKGNRYLAAAANLLGSIAAGFLAAWGGIVLARALLWRHIHPGKRRAG